QAQPPSPTVASLPQNPRSSGSRARSSVISLSARRTWGEPLIATSTIAGQRTIRARPSRTGRTRRWKAREAQRRAPSRFFGLAGIRGALIGRRQGLGHVMTRQSVLVHGLGVCDFGWT